MNRASESVLHVDPVWLRSDVRPLPAWLRRFKQPLNEAATWVKSQFNIIIFPVIGTFTAVEFINVLFQSRAQQLAYYCWQL